jgi:hypothetical protein
MFSGMGRDEKRARRRCGRLAQGNALHETTGKETVIFSRMGARACVCSVANGKVIAREG